MGSEYYENDRVLAEYLLFHYGWREEILPYGFGPESALDFPWRCAEVLLSLLPEDRSSRALDLGCAVGRSSFELARKCREVVAIDASSTFIDAARYLRDAGEYFFRRTDEGELTTPLLARVPDGIYREHVQFEVGDACALREDLGEFDCALLANLLCRLPDPGACLDRMKTLIRPGGVMMITTPGTWSETFTPRDKWLGGLEREGRAVHTEDGLKERLGDAFDLIREGDMAFLIREHARKFQWSVARMTLWRRK
ncbi:MAG: putative 4-mercaptohistidine N1-methyltransferase [Candidatus Methylacidiphilales bacterium]